MNDRKFFKFFSGLVGAVVALAVVLAVVARIVGVEPADSQTQTVADAQTVAERIKPIGEVVVGSSGIGSLIPSAHAGDEDKGKKVFGSACAACHAAGVAGAPKLGDAAAWKDRIAKGNDALYQNAIKGFQGKAGFMPAKGGRADLPDADVKASVDYMVSKVK